MKKEIKVFAPATVANVSCGFDILGFAIDAPGDELTLRITDKPGVVITKITGDEGKLPIEAEKNTAGVSLLAMMKELNAGFGVEMQLDKKMPLGSGLGSSAASAVASVFALNCLIDKPVNKLDLVKFAREGEKISCGENPHADNIAACIYGGFVLVRSNYPLDIIPLSAPDDLYCTILHPDVVVKTEHSRNILRKQLLLSTAVTQWGNIAGLVAGLLKSDYDLISRSMHDVIVEPVRSVLIPGFDAIKEAALSNGALGSSISGSGPSVFALSNSKEKAEKIGAAMQKVLAPLEVGSEVYISKINSNGPIIIG
jgi:homoserine kinase